MKDSPAPVAIFDKKLHFLNHSDVWLKEHKIESESVIGQSLNAVQDQIPEALTKVLSACLKGKSSHNKGEKFVLPNNGIVWYRWKVNPWHNEKGAVAGIIVILEDITQEKRQEELLDKAQRVARIGGWEVDLRTGKVYWTAITREIHEVSKDYIPNLEKGISFYKEGECREKISLLVSEAISSGTPWDTELIIVTAKGNEVWVRAKGEAELINGKCIRIYGTFQDINEKKQADLRYRKASERLSIATTAAGVGIWEYNVPDNNLIWDDNMYRLYGVKKKHFTGVYEAWEAAVHPDDKEGSAREVELAIKGEKEFNTTFRVVWANGEIHHIKAEAVVQRDASGNPIKMIGTNWDITPICKAEEKLQRLINTITDQNESLTNFAHIVSHNLRSHASNLSMLSGYLMQSENKASKSLEEHSDVLRMLNDATESLNETVVHLNEVVQIRSDINSKLEPIVLYNSFERVAKNIGKLIKDKNATYTLKLKKNLMVMAVPAYLDSILLNLFTNALKYSAPNRPPKIDVSAIASENHVILKFRDNGLGIDLKRHGKKLFGMYKTFHHHKDAKGIGLFITKNQIEAMGGKIEVESTVGEGTEFTLYVKRDTRS